MSRRAGNAKLYQLNREHLAAPYLEKLAALRTELIGRLREAVQEWRVKPSTALLFGSVARGEAEPRSDLDLLVVRPPGCDADEPVWREQLDRLQAAATAWTGNDARVLEYGEDELSGAPGKQERVISDALRDGIEIAGSRGQLARLVADNS